MSNRLLGKERVVVQDQGGVVSVPSPRLRASYSAATLLNAGSVWVLEDRHASSFERTLRQQSLIAMTRQPQLHLEAILLPHRLAEAGAATMKCAIPPATPRTVPRRDVCFSAALNLASSSSAAVSCASLTSSSFLVHPQHFRCLPTSHPTARFKCAFPRCKKEGVSTHNDEPFCHHHLNAVLVLDAHVEGKPQPVRYRYTKKKKQVRLCQVGPCRREGSHPHGEMLVCKAHVVLLEAKERYIDQQKAAEYALDKSSYQIASRTKVCNYVDCNNGHVTHKYHGVFCAEHLPVIDDLRDRIMMVKCLGDEAVQIPLQYEEIFLRK
ncbi:hypothetical protein PC119_g19523 [Phytophthora cactorum]|nr:hypothetical protein PC119_g19523 [Phytophthora cactorum]KAG3181846.1 hypothetical protein C6341_g6254 [Phytophthora cactorum]